jgi:hypothetical protein
VCSRILVGVLDLAAAITASIAVGCDANPGGPSAPSPTVIQQQADPPGSTGSVSARSAGGKESTARQPTELGPRSVD